MKKRPAVVMGGLLIAVLGAAAVVTLSLRTPEAAAVSDPRQESPIVRLATAARVTGSERGFTGIIGARVQSNLGFRVPGKIVERLVNVGQQVKAGQPLMRIDETDLRLALTAKRNAVAAARASVVQTDADERRYAKLVRNGWSSRQRYEQAKAALDTPTAPATKPLRFQPDQGVRQRSPMAASVVKNHRTGALTVASIKPSNKSGGEVKCYTVTL
jgi:multidrug efflux pump subunit AcrA (membrane-fusion protein)